MTLAGIEIVEVRISHLAYAPEIAQAMLRRQQASAVVAARSKIVEGAVGMVEMALDRLESGGVVELDAERKAAMVSNLMVVLCGDQPASPIVNTGHAPQLIVPGERKQVLLRMDPAVHDGIESVGGRRDAQPQRAARDAAPARPRRRRPDAADTRGPMPRRGRPPTRSA